MTFDINDFAKQVEADLVAVNPEWAVSPFGTEEGILTQNTQIESTGTIFYYVPKVLPNGEVVKSTSLLKISDGEPLDDLGNIGVIPEPTPPAADGTLGRIHFGNEAPGFPLQTPFWWDDEDGELRIWYVDVDTGQWVDISKQKGGPIHFGESPPEDKVVTPLWWDTVTESLFIWDVIADDWVSVNKDKSFLELTDTPDSYSGHAGKFVLVNATATGLDFTDIVIGTGDMLSATYDPTNVNGDAFSMGNMVEGATNKILTDTERTKLSNIEDNATADRSDAEIKTAYENNLDTNAFTDSEQTLLSNQSGSNSGDQDLSGYVDKSTAQTINGVKTFGSFIVTPSSAPLSDYQVANKKYVDDNAGGSALEVEDEGVSLSTAVIKFNFVGDGVTVTEPVTDEMLVTIGVTTTSPDFQTPTFENSWVNYGGGVHPEARYWKDSSGIVHIEGFVKNGTLDATIFTLPVGYKPTYSQSFVVMENDQAERLNVNQDGTVKQNTGVSNVWISLAGITFTTD